MSEAVQREAKVPGEQGQWMFCSCTSWERLTATAAEAIAHQVNDVIELEQIPDLIAAVDKRDEPGANLRRYAVDGIADDVVQQLVGVPRLSAALRVCRQIFNSISFMTAPSQKASSPLDNRALMPFQRSNMPMQ